MTSTRMRSPLRLAFLALGLGLGALVACFDGFDARGLPCEQNSQCGTLWLCEDNYCGGEILCGNGDYLPASMACDGKADCDDGVDEDPDRCGDEGVLAALCSAVDQVDKDCEAINGVDAPACAPFAGADDLCEDGEIDDPCMALAPLLDTCAMIFGQGADECEDLSELAPMCELDPTGDGDGDSTPAECEASPGDAACLECTKMACCDEVVACQANENCACWSNCLNEGSEQMLCVTECGAPTATTTAVIECGLSACASTCM